MGRAPTVYGRQARERLHSTATIFDKLLDLPRKVSPAFNNDNFYLFLTASLEPGT